MNKLFKYNEEKVRIETDQDGNIWFAGVDVCNILGYANPTDIINKTLDDDEKKLDYLTDRSGQKRKSWNISESGLYSLILSSSKPDAKPFKRWITHKVLPSIRKAGIYSTDSVMRKEFDLQTLTKLIETTLSALKDSKSETKRLEKELKEHNNERELLIKTNPNQLKLNLFAETNSSNQAI